MDEKLLRPACRLAVDVARAGLMADPAVHPPAALNMIVSFKRLSQSAYTTIRRVVDEDDAFRSRVAEAADEAAIGRVGWLWLTRPDGWEDEVADAARTVDHVDAESSARLRKRLEAAESAARRHADEAEAAAAARRRSELKLAELQEHSRPVTEERNRLREEVERLKTERAEAVRRLKATEAELAETRHQLKAARRASVDAQAELMALQRSVSDPPAAAAPRAPATPAPREVEPIDATAVRKAVDAAADAAASLSRALAEAAEALGGDRGATTGATTAGPPEAERPMARRSPTSRRRQPSLPPGVFDDSPEAHRLLITSAEAMLIVDGYNVARTAWTGLTPEEERRRTVRLLEDVHARSGGVVIVVFDGDSDAVAPAASRSVRVQFSPSGVTADQSMADLLATLSTDQPVVVVSTDRAVARDARHRGAVVLSSAEFLTAAGR